MHKNIELNHCLILPLNVHLSVIDVCHLLCQSIKNINLVL